MPHHVVANFTAIPDADDLLAAATTKVVAAWMGVEWWVVAEAGWEEMTGFHTKTLLQELQT